MTAPNKKTAVKAATSTTAKEFPKHSPNQRTKHIVVAEHPDGTVEAMCGYTWPKGRGVTRDPKKINHYPTCTACTDLKVLNNELVDLELTARALDYLAGIYRK